MIGSLCKKLFVLPLVAMALFMGGCEEMPNERPSSVTAVDDTATMTEDSGSIVIEVTQNDTDDTNDILTVTIEEGPDHGRVTVNEGNITYGPDGNFSGTDCFIYKVTDPGGDSDTAEVCVEVTNVNDAPVANTQSVSTNEDTDKTITLSASDVDGDGLSYTVTDPSNGSLSGTAPNLTYTPSPNYHGPDSFTFKVNDNTVDSNEATVSITVNSINDAPVAANDSASVDEDGSVKISVDGNDSDVDGTLNLSSVVVTSGPAHGTTSVTNGMITYTPVANYNGSDNFKYTINDNEGTTSNEANVSVNVIAVNDAPQMAAQSFSITYGATKTFTIVASDIDEDTLTFAKESDPYSGNIDSFNTASGEFTYAAPSDKSVETTTFDVNVTDGHETVSVTITINISESAAPVAHEDNNTIVEDGTTPVSGDIRSNDTDEDNAVSELNIVSVNGNANTTTVGTYGTLTWSSDGSYQYDLNNSNASVNALKNGEVLTDTFNYTIEDPSGESDSSSLAIKIEGQNDAPVLDDIDSVIMNEDDASHSFELNATDAEDDALIYRIVSAQPSFADVNISGTTLTITLKADQFGIANIEVEVDDGNIEDSKIFSLTVNSINDAPVATNDTASVSTEIAKKIHVLSNDSDVENDTLTITRIVSGPTNGIASLEDGNTTIQYTSSADFTGEVNLTYEITDGNLTAEANVTITVSDTEEYNITDLIGQNLSQIEDNCNGDDDACENDGTLVHWLFHDERKLDIRYWMLANSSNEKYRFDILDDRLEYVSSNDEINITNGVNRYTLISAGAKLLDGDQNIALYGTAYNVTFDNATDKQYLVDLRVVEGHPGLEKEYTDYGPWARENEENPLPYSTFEDFISDFTANTGTHWFMMEGTGYAISATVTGELVSSDDNSTVVGRWVKEEGKLIVYLDSSSDCWKDVYGIQNGVLMEGEKPEADCVEKLELYNEAATTKIDALISTPDNDYDVPEDQDDALNVDDFNSTMILVHVLDNDDNLSNDINVSLELFSNGMLRETVYTSQGIHESNPKKWEVDENGTLLLLSVAGNRDATIQFIEGDDSGNLEIGNIGLHFNQESNDPSAFIVMAQTPLLQAALTEDDVVNKMFVVAGYERSFMFRGESKGTLNVASKFDAKNRVKNIGWSINPYGEIVLEDESDHPMGTMAFFNKPVVAGTQGIRKYANTPPFNGLVERIFVESSLDLFGAVEPLVVNEDSFMGKLLMFQQLKLNIALYGDKRGDERKDCEIAHRMLNSPGTNSETCSWSIITDNEEKLQIVTDDSSITYTFTFTGNTTDDVIASGEMVGLAIQPPEGDPIDITIVLNSITDMDFNTDAEEPTDVEVAISGSVIYMLNSDVAVFETDSTGYHIEIDEDGNATRNDFCWKKEDNNGTGLYSLVDGDCTDEQFLQIDFYNADEFGKGSVARTFENGEFAGMLRVARYYKIESTTADLESDAVSNKIIKLLTAEYNTMIYAEDGTYYEYGRNTGTDEYGMGWWSDVATWSWNTTTHRVEVVFSNSESFNIGFDDMPDEGVEGDYSYTDEDETQSGNFITDEVIPLQSLLH